MLAQFANIFRVPELRKRILFTLGLLFVYRVGGFIPTPGVDGAQLALFFKDLASRQGNTLFGLMNMFTGGAMDRCTIFALGIMPNVSASIIIQLLTAVIPYLEKLAKEGQAGMRKINQLTRYFTVVLALFQAYFISIWLSKSDFGGKVIVSNPGISFTIITMITLAAGTTFIMWLGEQITERGIGNGISLLITVGIISRLPSAMSFTYSTFFGKEIGINRHPIVLVIMLIILFVSVASVIQLTMGQRKIPVQYAKRVVGRKVYGGQSTYIPLKVNFGGVIPIIFASSLLLFPATIGGFVPGNTFFHKIGMMLANGTFLYNVLYVLLIVFFCYFWTATQFNPIQWAEDMKRNGAFIPGVRPGQATAEFFDYSMTRVTLSGAVFLALIAVFPSIVGKWFNLPYLITEFFGGTALLIVVGVMLDTIRQIESHLTMRHYEGFMRRGKFRGR
jgi:preprotein translocase subunit SecY